MTASCRRGLIRLRGLEKVQVFYVYVCVYPSQTPIASSAWFYLIMPSIPDRPTANYLISKPSSWAT